LKWQTLRHHGVAFPPPYEYRGLTIRIRSERVKLEPLQEEMLFAWAKKKDTPYVLDPVFQQNFLSDLRAVLPERYADITLDDLDLSELHRIVEREKTANLPLEVRKERAAERKRVREELKARYGQAEVDGKVTELSNYLVEPPGIFMGRGAHPRRGRWKRKIEAKDVTLNLDEGAPIPPGDWGRIVHDHDSMWIASWFDELSGKIKYIWLADTSHLRQAREKKKYDQARKLEKVLDKVRQCIHQGMQSDDERERKIATVCYLIDRLAMRVGDEKDEDEADTVGASTLRVEHVHIGAAEIEFDFLGKDSVRWVKRVAIDGGETLLARNLLEFAQGKQPEDLLFDGINSRKVNRYLGAAMPGLTAKVFRTYHATTTVKTYLERNGEFKPDDSRYEKEYAAKMANLQAAITCNHKRTPPKTWEQTLARKKESLDKLLAAVPKTEKAAERLRERVAKARAALALAEATRDYNLNTSLKNYIDPRVYKAWGDHVGFDWTTLYPKTLQRKFAWAQASKTRWQKAKK